jgi:hypothetical protein
MEGIMRAKSVRLAAILITVACFHRGHVRSAGTVRENSVMAISWMQVMSESQYALPAHPNFVPLRIVRWFVSASNHLRIEDGEGVFITDCQTGEAIELDLQKKTVRRKQENPKPDLYRKLRHAPRERGARFVENGKFLGRDAALYAWEDGRRHLIWCDDRSGEILYGEDWDPIDARENGISSVSFNYVHNARLPEELFSLQPPPGFKLVE